MDAVPANFMIPVTVLAIFILGLCTGVIIESRRSSWMHLDELFQNVTSKLANLEPKVNIIENDIEQLHARLDRQHVPENTTKKIPTYRHPEDTEELDVRDL